MQHFIKLGLLTQFRRFTPEEKAKRNPCSFFPFGHGPRNCIGQRLGMLLVKMALITVVQKYKILPTPETEVVRIIYMLQLLLHILK